MLGHYHVAVQLEMITIPDFVQGGEKKRPSDRRVEQWAALVTAERQEMKMPLPIVAFQTSRHGRTPCATPAHGAPGVALLETSQLYLHSTLIHGYTTISFVGPIAKRLAIWVKFEVWNIQTVV